MEAKIWQRLPENLLFMILARLPIRVLGKMRSVCKQWNSLLSSRDALQIIGPNWSLHSTPGFLFQIYRNGINKDVEYWVIEGLGSDIYKVTLTNQVVVDTCKSIFCCHTNWDPLDLYIGIPGTMNWRQLPRPPIPRFYFTGLSFDSSTGVCTLLLGHFYLDQDQDQAQAQVQSERIEMCIYDSESNAWTAVSMMVPDHILPWGKAVFSKGKFYWTALINEGTPSHSHIVAFNTADGLWTEIRLPEGCQLVFSEKFGVYDGQVVLVDRKEVECVRMWKLNEAENFEIWFEVRESSLTKGLFRSPPLVVVNNSDLIMVIDWKMEMWIFNSKGKLIVRKMGLPFATSQRFTTWIRAVQGSGSAFESNNLWWP